MPMGYCEISSCGVNRTPVPTTLQRITAPAAGKGDEAAPADTTQSTPQALAASAAGTSAVDALWAGPAPTAEALVQAWWVWDLAQRQSASQPAKKDRPAWAALDAVLAGYYGE